MKYAFEGKWYTEDEKFTPKEGDLYIGLPSRGAQMQVWRAPCDYSFAIVARAVEVPEPAPVQPDGFQIKASVTLVFRGQVFENVTPEEIRNVEDEMYAAQDFLRNWGDR